MDDIPDKQPAARTKVLIVDDSAVVLEMGQLVLEEAGFQVVTLDNPLTLAAVLRREKPDLVLIDVNMPLVTGDAVTKIVHRTGFTKETVVLLYSDRPAKELEERARTCGAQGYIRKTGDSQLLVDTVKSFLRRDLSR